MEHKVFYPQYNSEMALKYGLSVAVVYGYLWTSCKNYSGSVQVGFATIGRKVGLCRRQVIRIIDFLEESGFISIERFDHRTSIYYIENCDNYPCCDDYDYF